MYSLGCTYLLSRPPFRNRVVSPAVSRYRRVGSRPSMYVSLLLRLAGIYTHSLTPRPIPCLTAMLSTNPFFNSLPISTLNFHERSTFASKPREEKIASMKGFARVLDRFLEGLRASPSLLEEVGRSLILEPWTSPRFYPVADERVAPTT